MPFLLSSLLQRTRTGLLALLLVVLPLQGVVQLVAGIQGHRHVHTGARAPAQGSVLSSLVKPLRAVLDELHAGQDARLRASSQAWGVSRGAAEGLHEHGGVFHRHGHDTADVLDVGDAADDGMGGSATAFLAWLPVAPAVTEPRSAASRPGSAAALRLGRVVSPPVMPPRA